MLPETYCWYVNRHTGVKRPFIKGPMRPHPVHGTNCYDHFTALTFPG